MDEDIERKCEKAVIRFLNKNDGFVSHDYIQKLIELCQEVYTDGYTNGLLCSWELRKGT